MNRTLKRKLRNLDIMRLNVFHRAIKHWGILLIGAVAFAVVLMVVGEPVTASRIFARIVEALGDVAFDRAVAGPES